VEDLPTTIDLVDMQRADAAFCNNARHDGVFLGGDAGLWAGLLGQHP